MRAAFLAPLALALGGCVTVVDASAPAPPASAPPSPTLDSAAPDAMRWLYGSGEAAAVSIQAWRMLADYAVARSRERRVPQSVMMGLPADRSVNGVGAPSCRRADGTTKPLAVVFDVDETVILNEGYEYHLATGNTYARETWAKWERDGAAFVAPVPGAVTGIRRLREAGIAVVFNTNRQFSPQGAARAIAAAGLGEAVHKDTLFLRGDDGTASGGKDGRRALIAERYCVIALAGDNLGDFADVFNDPDLSPLQRRELAARRSFAQMWGDGWFALPNPVYGDAIKGTIGEVFAPAVRWQPTPGDAPAIMKDEQ